MELNVFAIEMCVASRLAEARAASARRELLAWACPARPGVLAALGLALIRIERRLRHAGGRRCRPGREPLPSLP